jgi:predicted nucleic acid-binding protein
MVAFDNTILSLLIFSDAELRQGSDGQKVEHARERVLGLVQQIEETRDRVIVPTPALSELLVTEGADVQDILTTLRSSAYIRIESFDERAAVELAMRLRAARKVGDQRDGLPITKGAMKFDRQIVAIALVNGATILYSDDDAVAKFGAGCGLEVRRVVDLPIPASQQSLPFPEAGAAPAAPPAPSQAEVQPVAQSQAQGEVQPAAEEQQPAEPSDQSSTAKPNEPQTGADHAS